MSVARACIVCAAALLSPACSSDSKHEAAVADGDDAAIVPDGLSVTALAGGNGVLDVIALTLRRGAGSTELYAALRNDGDIPACDAAMSVELFDKAEQSVAAGIGGLLTAQFYRLTDGSGSIAACVSPGAVTMAAVTDLPFDLTIEDVGYVVYRCPYFALDVVPIAGLTVERLKSVTSPAGTLYQGTFVNELDVTVNKPSVTVFPINRVQRPLGVAIGTGMGEIPPGGSWTFETELSEQAGLDYVAFPAGAIEH